MRALILALTLAIAAPVIAAPAPANALCFSAFHKPKVTEQKVETVNGVPVAVKTTAARKPESFCQTVMRATAITLIVQGIVITAKVGLAVATGILIL
jgi:hypothetical protein